MEVVAYHAGLPRELRADVQRRFMAGSAPVVVATNAFGMGVDKANVRTVCHESVPSSIEAYYQEAGRAGRDGQPARALLFSTGRDKGLHVFFIERSEVDDDQLKSVARKIVAAAEGSPPRFNLHMNDLARAEGEEEAVRAIVGCMARAGVVQPAPSAPDRVAGRVIGVWDRTTLAVCRSATQEGTRQRWRQYRAVWAWVEGEGCRRAGILRHFGDRSGRCPRAVLRRVRPVARCRRRPCGAVRQSTLAPAADLEAAILQVVGTAQPGVGRTRCVEILRGGRSKAIAKHSYDGLPNYGAYRDRRAEDVLACIDALVSGGLLACSPRGRAGSSRADRAFRVGVLASGTGSNLQAILDRVHGRGGRGRRGGLGQAWRAGARRAPRRSASRPRRSRAPSTRPRGSGHRDGALAGRAGRRARRARGLHAARRAAFLAAFPQRVINVHPALLPAFPGIRAVEQALEYGVKVFGVTVHFVDEGVDSGPVILQRALELPDVTDPDEIRDRLRPVEHDLLTSAVALFARGAVRPDPDPTRVASLSRSA